MKVVWVVLAVAVALAAFAFNTTPEVFLLAAAAMTPAEEFVVEAKRICEEAKTFRQEFEARLHYVEQRAVEPRSSPASLPLSSVDEQVRKFLQSTEVMAFREKGVSTGKIDLGLSLKSLTSDLATGGSSDGGWNVQPDRMPGWVGGYGFHHNSFLDALPLRQNFPSNALEGHQLVGFVAAAAVQAAEGDLKAEQDVVPELVRWPVATIAAWMNISKQLLDDDESVRTSLGGLLGHTVLRKAESQALYGTGTNGEMRGILTDAAVEDIPSSGDIEERIGERAAEMAADGYPPNLVVMHPTVWHDIRSRRATGGDEQYLHGSATSPAPPVLWNVPVVQASTIQATDVLLLDRRYSLLFERQRVVAALGFEDSDNMRRNLVTALVEGRWGVALFDSAAALKIEITS